MKAWLWVKERYRREHPNWEIIEGSAPVTQEHPYRWCWSKGEAFADARERTDADLLVLADADVFVPVEQLLRACAAASEGATWAVPYITVRRLGVEATQALLHTGEPPETIVRGMLDRTEYTGVRGGGIFVMPAALWDRYPVPDPRFRGWGGEDEAAGIALATLVGPPVNVDGHCWHLWHPHALPGARGPMGANQLALYKRYRNAAGDPERMREVMD